MSDIQRKFFQERIPIYRTDPVLYHREVLQFETDGWQQEALMDLAGYGSQKVSIRSGQGVGKTGIEAGALLWFLTCFPFPRVVATAPTRQQLHDVLWSEVAKWQNKSPLLQEILKWTKTYIYMRGYEKRWFAVARTATKAENMQGFHEDNMLFIVDEASGVADPIMEAILGTLSGQNNKLLMCGNPTRASGTFYDSHTRDRTIYCCHKVSSLDSPRTNKENIDALIKKYGIDSNVVRVRVLGEFPLQEDDVFIPINIIEAATMREIDGDIAFIRLGVDVARFGDDETIIAKNVSGNITLPIIRKGQDLMRTVGDIVKYYHETIETYKEYTGMIEVNIDDTGLGGGVTDRLREVKRQEGLERMAINPVNFSSAVPDKKAAKEYANITTYAWGILRELLLNEEISLPEKDSDLVGQLSARKYTLTSTGKLEVEPKKTMKKRGLPSPDRADATALACYKAPKHLPIGGAVIVSEPF